jgi:hypothetical protein
MNEFQGSRLDLANFLLRRSGTTYLVLDVMKELIEKQTASMELSALFSHINDVHSAKRTNTAR